MTDLFEGTGHGPDATTPVKRLWWPEYYVDECMPAGTEHPDGWILGAEGQEWLLGTREDEGFTPFTVKAGDVVIFHWCETRGRNEIIVRPDGSFDLIGREPVDWTCCWEPGETDSVSDTIETFASSAAQLIRHPDGDRLNIDFMKWDEARFRLVVEAGKASFEPAVEAAPSPPRGEGWGEGEPQTGEASNARPV